MEEKDCSAIKIFYTTHSRYARRDLLLLLLMLTMMWAARFWFDTNYNRSIKNQILFSIFT
ncbi:hypothetical protein E2C01_025028 [Portunus trituberculatus]|uniref:Uncharacterized protein n=1 Tax=Portunus trituberculatus TaxID=210409 RepID=A0A5B7EC79_PORTR|nr:hypothetical protein [Portunus trituberculatus]